MAGSGKKWLTGCAIGCVILLVLVGLLIMASYMMISGTLEGFRQAKQTGDELTAAHGAIVDFTPPMPQALPADRLRLFITVRESLRAPQEALEDALLRFPDKIERDEESPLRTIATIFRGLGDLIRPMGEYVDARNRALLDAGMGQGEYLFYYGLVYYSWQGHSPGDVPRMEGRRQGRSNFRIHGGKDAAFGRAQAWRRYRFYTQAMLRNLQAAMTAAADPAGESALTDLNTEINRLAGDPDHIAWADGLPLGWETSLEAEKERLAGTYSESANIFEWPTGAGASDGGLDFNFD